jgi:tripartite ATP-independent transporter DctM subunit
MNQSGIAEDILESISDIMGSIQGGLAHVNILASLVFSGMSGSALADVGSIGKIIIPSMENQGYSPEYSAALTSASATTGPIFPPSVPVIIFAIIAEVSVIDLFIAGIVPALLLVAIFMILTALIGYWYDFPKQDPVSIPDKIRAFVSTLPYLSVPVVLVGGMLLGFYGPTEIAAVTVGYLILILLVFKNTSEIPTHLWTAAVETVRINSLIMIIVPGAALFSWVLSLEQTADAFANVLFSITTSAPIQIFLICLFLLIIGLFLEAVSALLISIPLVFPVGVEIGMDPVHVGILMIFTLMIGLLTPPVGLSLYLSSEIAEVRIEDVVRSIVPYYVGLFICLLIIAYVPAVSLWLPAFM